MSRTDKDRPYHVRVSEGAVHHDHSRGVCTLDHPDVVDWRTRSGHRKVCAKRVTVPNACTKGDPHRDWLGNRACWTNRFEHTYDALGMRVVWVERTWVQCTRPPERIETRVEIPCECDSWLYETCYRVEASTSRCRRRCCVPRKNDARRARYSARQQIAAGLTEYHDQLADEAGDVRECEDVEFYALSALSA